MMCGICGNHFDIGECDCCESFKTNSPRALWDHIAQGCNNYPVALGAALELLRRHRELKL